MMTESVTYGRMLRKLESDQQEIEDRIGWDYLRGKISSKVKSRSIEASRKEYEQKRTALCRALVIKEEQL